MRKKIVILVMVVALMLIAVSCSNSDNNANNSDENSNELKSAEVGEYITFGKYEQDNNLSNGKEDIEWLVLAKEGDKALVISKYALDCKPYNREMEDITWENCTLREWLNDEFVNSAFSSSEQAKISTVTVSAEKHPEYDIYPGNDTSDKVFLLSVNEVNKYFASNSERECQPTAYAAANGVYVYRENGKCYWWLRTPGSAQNDVSAVGVSGHVSHGDAYMNDDDGSVRPAMWIELK